MANDTEGQLVDLWNREEESTGLKGWMEENVSKKGLSKLYNKAAEYQKEQMAEEVIPGLTQGQLYEGIIGTVGGVDFTSYKKAAKSIEFAKRIKNVAKYERMTEGIDNGSLLFANKKWQKMIDDGDMMIEANGDIFMKMGDTGSVGLMAKSENIHEMSRYSERYADYHKLQKEVMTDADKAWRTLTDKEKALGKELGKSPTIKKQMRDTVLKLEKLLSGD